MMLKGVDVADKEEVDSTCTCISLCVLLYVVLVTFTCL